MQSGEVRDVASPAAKMGNVSGVSNRPRLADKAFHRAAIGQLQRSNAEWGGDLRHKLAKARQRDVPQFDDNRAAAFGLHQTRLWRLGIGEGEQFVAVRGG